MTPFVAHLLLVALISADAPAGENPVLDELLHKGVKMSDGSMVKLPPPIMADGLDAAGQRAALSKLADTPGGVDQLVAKSYYAPVVVKVRTVKRPEDEGPARRSIDMWFVAHGDWNTLTSKEFLDTVMKSKDEGKSQVVSKSGALSDEEMTKRKLPVTTREGYEERFVYSTFSLFDRVEISATRFAVAQSGKDSLLAAARLDPRFDNDPEYPNQWRRCCGTSRPRSRPGRRTFSPTPAAMPRLRGLRSRPTRFSSSATWFTRSLTRGSTE